MVPDILSEGKIVNNFSPFYLEMSKCQGGFKPHTISFPPFDVIVLFAMKFLLTESKVFSLDDKLVVKTI